MRTLLLGLSLMACTPDRVISPEPKPALAQPHAAPAAAPLIGVVAARANQVVAARSTAASSA
jgi:hypothetical protein